jgi:hypothetical protein
MKGFNINKPPKRKNNISDRTISTLMLVLSLSLFIHAMIVSYNGATYKLNIDETEEIIDEIDIGEIYNGSIVSFSARVIDVLNIMFDAYENHEYAVCLYGKIENNTYHITNIGSIKIYYSNSTAVSHGTCQKDYIANLHNHPNGARHMSDVDINSYENRKNKGLYKDKKMNAIQYGINKFTFYTYDDMENSLKWKKIN